MGVGGHFWDLLKPNARHEGPDFLRNKRIAVDLSFWIVQHETAIKTYVRKPHLRITFFRTINLYSKELLELFGMPVVKAKGEAEALCAQLNSEGYVDACITADSDAFLFGAKCVIKSVRPNSKEPFECYHMSDIEAGLGLKRKHLVGISLLVGNDHDLKGVPGIGLDTALRFVQNFTEDEILDRMLYCAGIVPYKIEDDTPCRLHEIGNGDTPLFQGGIKSLDDCTPGSDESSQKIRCSHCSFCGHPGSKRAHFKSSCQYCTTSNGERCVKKADGFRCDCSACDMGRKEKEQKKQENWRTKVCSKIAMESNFPNAEIIEMYLCDNHSCFSGTFVYIPTDGPCISWGSPKTEMLVDFLACHKLWEPSYIRRMILPMLSTIFLREMATNRGKTLLYGQYEFDSVLRVKIRNGRQFYVVKWRKAVTALSRAMCTIPSRELDMQQDVVEFDESPDLLEEPDGPKIHVDEGSCYLVTDENMDLVRAAYPEKVERFLHEKELKESKRRKSSSLRSEGTRETSKSTESRGVQLSITEFFRSSKVQVVVKPGEDLTQIPDGQSKEKRERPTQNLSKSVRRRLLFD
ncbi:Flap endonuclease GEN-like 1 [Morella rubra]|uniref:Flap endonuclease GEN-like 1 n=1 Tax=Morella rubra TaxID=262757 RepID=A0A6A1VP53_9ROSI|nr:Flap endonuclease GEN-like 1 [Morella rubra]